MQSPPKKRRVSDSTEPEKVPAGLLKFMTQEDLTATALRMTEKGHQDRAAWPMATFAKVYKKIGKNDRVLQYLRGREGFLKMESLMTDRTPEIEDKSSSDEDVEVVPAQ